MIVASFEVRARHFWVGLVGMIPSVLLGVGAAMLVGAYGIFVFFLAMGAWFYLFERRSKTGLRTRTWETILDRKRTLSGKFMQSGQVIPESHFDDFQIIPSSIPVARPDLAITVSDIIAGDASKAPSPVVDRPVIGRASPLLVGVRR